MNVNPCAGPLSRRSFLTMGTLGITGLSLADVMHLRAAAGKSSAAPDTSVIFVLVISGEKGSAFISETGNTRIE